MERGVPMEMTAVFEHKWRRLNPMNQKQASDFMDFLLSRQQAEAVELPKHPKKTGVWNGEPYYISDDFDEPLDDFKEYM